MISSPAGGWLDRCGNRDRNFVQTYSSAVPVNTCFNLGFLGKWWGRVQLEFFVLQTFKIDQLVYGILLIIVPMAMHQQNA